MVMVIMVMIMVMMVMVVMLVLVLVLVMMVVLMVMVTMVMMEVMIRMTVMRMTTMMISHTEGLLNARHFAKYFASVISFNLCNNCGRQVCYYSHVADEEAEAFRSKLLTQTLMVSGSASQTR